MLLSKYSIISFNIWSCTSILALNTNYGEHRLLISKYNSTEFLLLIEASKMYLVGVLFSFLIGNFTTLAAVCPTDWWQHGESCYLLITKTRNWTAAVQTCEGLGSTLVVPKSKEEQDFIWDYHRHEFYYDGEVHESLWVGCSDAQDEGTWDPCPLRDAVDGFQNWLSQQQNLSAMLLQTVRMWWNLPQKARIIFWLWVRQIRPTLCAW